jgi:hypothetical protein
MSKDLHNSGARSKTGALGCSRSSFFVIEVNLLFFFIPTRGRSWIFIFIFYIFFLSCPPLRLYPSSVLERNSAAGGGKTTLNMSFIEYRSFFFTSHFICYVVIVALLLPLPQPQPIHMSFIEYRSFFFTSHFICYVVIVALPAAAASAPTHPHVFY